MSTVKNEKRPVPSWKDENKYVRTMLDIDIEKRLVPKIRARFGDAPMEEARRELPGSVVCKAIFRCIHPGFGDIYVEVMRDEITVTFGRFTHVHFWEAGEQFESDEVYAEEISEGAVKYLERVFADEVEFHGSHEGGGGCHPRKAKRRGFIRRALTSQHYVWSGPLDR